MASSFIQRVAFLGFHSGVGGIGKDTINLANALIEQGVGVDLLFTTAEPEDVRHLHPRINRVSLASWNSRVRAVLPLARYLRRVRPDALVTSNHWSSETAALARSLFAAPGALFFRAQTNTSLDLARRAAPKRLLRRWAMDRSFRQADAIIAVSNGVAEDLRCLFGLGPQRVPVIYNSVVPPDVDEQARSPVEHPWFRDPSVPILLSVGRLARPKDFPTLLRAFARLRAGRSARLVILGEGPLRGTLEKEAKRLGIEGDLDLPGHRDNPFAYMARASAFVLSSSREGFGNVLAEAMSVGAPVVSTDCPHGPREILEGGRYGPLVPVGDDNALARALARILDDPLPGAVLREGAERFTPARAAGEFLDMLGKP